MEQDMPSNGQSGRRRGIRSISLRGFKSIKELEDFQPGPLTVLIGANGAGKSNFLSFFRMLRWALTPPGQLAEFVARQGGSWSLLTDGAFRTQEIRWTLEVDTGVESLTYAVSLWFMADDRLGVTMEQVRREGDSSGFWPRNGAPEYELRLSNSSDETSLSLASFLGGIQVFHFSNTSEVSRIRSMKWSEHDGLRLKEDGGNLAAVLLRLKRNEPLAYRRIVETIRLGVPKFSDFVLEPEHGSVLLRWTEVGSDLTFWAGQASDGALRWMALVTLLRLPEKERPAVVILDEPELGLHPYAIEVLAGLIESACVQSQVIVATQSSQLVNCFDPEAIVVVERNGRESSFKRLSKADLAAWLENYSVAELWEKNVFGGVPSR